MTAPSKPEILSSTWDHNGSWKVEVAGPWPNSAAAERRARTAARRVDTMGKVQWTRLEWVRLEHATERVVYTFTVSRLDREHYSRVTVRYA